VDYFSFSSFDPSLEFSSILREIPPHIFSLLHSENRFKFLVGKEKESIRVIAVLSFEEFVPYAEVEHVAFFGKELKKKEQKEFIQEIEKEALFEKAEWIAIRFEENEIFPFPLKNTLLKERYLIDKNPYLEIEQFTLDTFSPPWFFQKYPLKEGFMIKRWQELSPLQEAALKKRVENGNVPEFISPFQGASYVQPINSLFLESSGEVIGWMITHTYPSSPQTIDYTAFFIEREFRKKEMALALLQRSLQLQFIKGKSLGINKMRFEVSYLRSKKSWIQFIHKGLRPFSTKTLYAFLAKKQLL